MARAQTGTDDAGGSVMEEEVRPSAEGEASQGDAEDAPRPDAGEGGRTYRSMTEWPVGQAERVDPIPEPEVVGDEGAITEPMAMPAVMPVQPAMVVPERPEGPGVVASSAALSEVGTSG